MSEQFAFGLLVGAMVLLVLCIIGAAWLYSRDEKFEPADELAPPIGGSRGAGGAGGLTWRQRYECTCGWHATKENEHPPSHIKCGRCGGVAVARDRAERA